MPPKRKGATAEDEIEAPPEKITKGNKEVVEPRDRVWTLYVSLPEKNIIGLFYKQ